MSATDISGESLVAIVNGFAGLTLTGVIKIIVLAIVLLILRSSWRRFNWNMTMISAIVWGSLVSIHVSLLVFLDFNMWKLYLLGIPGQIAVFLWFRMYRPMKEKEKTYE